MRNCQAVNEAIRNNFLVNWTIVNFWIDEYPSPFQDLDLSYLPEEQSISTENIVRFTFSSRPATAIPATTSEDRPQSSSDSRRHAIRSYMWPVSVASTRKPYNSYMMLLPKRVPRFQHVCHLPDGRIVSTCREGRAIGAKVEQPHSPLHCATGRRFIRGWRTYIAIYRGQQLFAFVIAFIVRMPSSPRNGCTCLSDTVNSS